MITDCNGIRKRLVCASSHKSMYAYQLTHAQLHDCKKNAIAVTKARQIYSKGKGQQWHRGQFDRPSTSTMIGFKGEIAFYEILSVYFKTLPMYQITVQKKVKKHDFEWKTPLGNLHEVKTTVGAAVSEANFVREKAIKSADLFWFMSVASVDESTVFLRGWLTQSELIERATLVKGKGNWKNYRVDTDQLNGLNDFLKLRGKR